MLNTREIAQEYRLNHWAGIMREKQESGLSIKAFCKAAGFHENVYFYWQRKLRKAAHEELANKSTDRKSRSPVPNGWTLCEAGEATDKEKVLAIEIGPCRVLAKPDVDLELLMKVCQVLIRL